MNTKLVSEWKISPEQAKAAGIYQNNTVNLETMLKGNIHYFLNEERVNTPFFAMLSNCFELYSAAKPNDAWAERWRVLTNNIFYDKKAQGYWVIKDRMSDFGRWVSGTQVSEIEHKINALNFDPISKWILPNKEQLLCLTNLSSAPFSLSRGRPANDYRKLFSINGKCQGLDTDAGCLRNIDYGYLYPFLWVDNSTSLSEKALFIDFLQKGFTPVALQNNRKYKTLLKLFHFDNDKVFAAAKNDAVKIFQQSMPWSQQSMPWLLKEDSIRADIAPYHQKMLEDTELGHWSLWQDELNTRDFVSVELATPLVARDPKSSINDGVVAIDFGTKSTVVVYQKDNVNIHPMRVGTGDLSKEVEAYHYENPTIMEFIDLEAFTIAYNDKANKPNTRWQDLTIAHTAQNAMQGSDSSKFNSFLAEIKQWAGDKNRKLKIVDQKGNIIDLPPFLELKDSDFNPIEIYAYYLGLYINNLNNGIFMDYILSFPVTYEMSVRNKIIASFEKGLKKSLPAELGEATISKLTVSKGASEPAAYALTALQQHGFEPEGDERIFYSVFDFGGGTTDFDFGIFREPTDARDRRRFDYVIEHFGAGGDKFLGGENLLELLAFEVFKKNKSSLLEKSIQFEKHPEKDSFAGSEQLLSTSQEARVNTKRLCLELRPYWEAHEDFAFSSTGTLSLNLTDVHGIEHSAVELDIDEDELNAILAARIERGVQNFFNALRLAFSNSNQMLSDIENVNIFLAGNSSKSRFVTELFEKHIALQNKEMGLLEGQSRFTLHQPLGANQEDVEKPTAKTGVAFGLIDSREGGKIKVIDHNVGNEDIRFKFYLGEERKKKFKPVIDREVPFNQWVNFCYADYAKCEIYYTDEPSSSTGDILTSDSSIKKKVIKLDVVNDDAFVYLKAVSPTKIEYVVALENDIENDIYLSEIVSIEF